MSNAARAALLLEAADKYREATRAYRTAADAYLATAKDDPTRPARWRDIVALDEQRINARELLDDLALA